MSEQEDIMKSHFDAIKEDLIAKYEKLGMRASGKWAETLEADVNRLKGIIRGQHYTEQLVDGRKPGRMPPVSAIKKWIEDKGIMSSVRGNISISSLAFLIARKIGQEGTKYFQQGGTDLVSSVITPERIQMIIDDVSEFHINGFVSEIESVFKKMAA